MAKKKKKKKEKQLQEEKQLQVEVVATPEGKAAERIQSLATQLSSLATYKDPARVFSLTKQFRSDVAAFTDKYLKGNDNLEQVNKYFGMFGLGDLFGFRPQGTNFWQLFPNPFGIFAYLAENHWAVWCCREEFTREIASDGYYFVGNEANFKKAQKVMHEFELEEKRIEWADHCKTYGNFWVWPKFTKMGALKELKTLLPQYLEPRFSADGQRVIQWCYYVGFVSYLFDADQLWHEVYRKSMRHYDLGNPPLATLLTDLEADIQASMYNNMVFQKGGLIGLAILMEANNKNGIPGTNTMQLGRQIEDELRANHSGARAGYDTIVLSGAKDIKQLNKLADMDGAFHKGSDKCSKQVAHVMGVPHERLGIVTNSSEQYHAASLEDQAALRFDQSIYQVIRVPDKFINTKIFPACGINDVQIRARERYNAFTEKMAIAIAHLGKLDGLMSVDEARVDIMHLPPLGGKEGKMPLRVIPNVTATIEGLPPIKPISVPVTESTLLNTPIDQEI